MYIGSLSPVSNREDWQEAITLTDEDSGELIDISACSITMTVRDVKNKCVVLKGSTDHGEITLPEAGTFMWSFLATAMGALCQAEYEVGVRISQDDRTAQLIIGTVNVMEGIDQQ